MPVSIQLPGWRKDEEDGLDKLAKALNVAKSGFGIAADMKAIEQAKLDKEAKLKAAKAIEAAAEDEAQGIISAKDRATILRDLIPAKEGEKGAFILRSKGGDKGAPLTEWVRQAPRAAKEVDPYLLESRRLDVEKKKQEMAGVNKNSQEFSKRFRNIQTQISDIRKMVKDDGTFETFGPHNRTLQQKIDSIAIDAAKLFDPQSVARESEVAAFKNMLFEGGELGIANATADQLMEKFGQMIESRAVNEGLAHLLPGNAAPAAAGEDAEALAWAMANPGDPRAQAIIQMHSGVAKK